MPELREEIRAKLKRFEVPSLNFADAVVDLLKTLGYESDVLRFSGTPDEFNEQFPITQGYRRETESARQFLSLASRVHLVAQITDEEIDRSPTLFKDTVQAYRYGIKSFLFIGVELEDGDHPRGAYATLTREINKHFMMPTVVIFHNPKGERLTIAFITRRVSRTDTSRDVMYLEKVHLIKDINLQNTHRAHLDILQDLSLSECVKRMESGPKNFEHLLKVWLETLDTQKLNRRFYKDLFAWFEQAKQTAKFPTGDPKQPIKQEDQIIRLITRLLFVWFIKEKGLVAEGLFDKDKMKPLLKDDCGPEGGDYYRAVLQNLFFATLNTEIGKRGFSNQDDHDYRNFNLYRYATLIRDEKNLLNFMQDTPFINGGLFDCLDTEAASEDGGYRLDGYSDPDPDKYPDTRRKAWQALRIPNNLFFDPKNGLFPLLKHYKFTVEENTPIEQEVALDPELLGNVFENLLAEYNPETRETARKQSGSYYTPREIVDYMVNEALIARLADLAQPSDGDGDFWRDRLRYLLDYAHSFDDAEELFQEEEKERIVKAISQIKVLDPAAGSGAFPMGILHKLTLALRRIDPQNQRWEELQKRRAKELADTAFDTPHQATRDEELKEISQVFETYKDSDFGRKLYLIQNSIFGVDIQPVACQIAKLRFFISLAIEQTADRKATNFGIKPLPNLETKFIAADALIALAKQGQMTLSNEAVRKSEAQLKANRERHYNARDRATKLDCIKQDKKLRRELAEELKAIGFDNANAERIGLWDPYDQNGVADWFDPEYMFGVRDGFDVVIGNPPYIQLQKNGGRLANRYQSAGFQTLERTGDIYQLFYEKGAESLSNGGLLCYITSNSWLRARYGESSRRYFHGQHSPLKLLEMGKDIFENTIVDTNILLLRKGNGNEPCQAVDMDRLEQKDFPPADNLWSPLRPKGGKPWSILSSAEQGIKDKMETVGTPLKDWDVNIHFGIKTGYTKAFLIDTETRDRLIREDPRSEEVIKPILRGRDIRRYSAQWAGLWLIAILCGSTNQQKRKNDTSEGYIRKSYPALLRHLENVDKTQTGKGKGLFKRGDQGDYWWELRACAYYPEFSKEKIVWKRIGSILRFCYENSGILPLDSTCILTGEYIKYICGVLNSKFGNYMLFQSSPTTGMGDLIISVQALNPINIPLPNRENSYIISGIETSIDKILDMKANNAKADTTDLETEIDQLVYKLYGLTEEEISIVENSK